MFNILLSSIGGCGSTNLFNFISKHKNTNPNNFHEGSSPYKHSMYPPTEKEIEKAVFVIGNVYNSVISLLSDEYLDKKKTIPCINSTHLLNKGLPPIRMPIQEYFHRKNDLYEIEKQITNWINANVHYDILIIRGEKLYDSKTRDKIFSFLDLPVSLKTSYPSQKKRKSNYENYPFKNDLVLMYSEAQKLVESINDYVVIDKKT